MMKILKEAVSIVLLAGLVGLAVNTPLLLRYARGEFRADFLGLKDHVSMVVIDKDRALGLFEQGRAIFIDSRSPAQYAQGHIPGARNVPWGDPSREELLQGLNPDRSTPVIVYCSGEACRDSFHLAQWISDRGYFANIFVFSGGWETWTSAGRPVERSDDKE